MNDKFDAILRAVKRLQDDDEPDAAPAQSLASDTNQ